jgi:hypothetical protein
MLDEILEQQEIFILIKYHQNARWKTWIARCILVNLPSIKG